MKCTQVVKYGVDDEGERGDEIECDNEAVCMACCSPLR